MRLALENKLYNLKDAIRGGEKPPCDHTLGISILHAENGIAKGNWNADFMFLNGNGVIMGGFVSAVADTMMAYAMVSCLDEDRMFSSINLQTTFHRPVQKGMVQVEAKIERMGRNIAYATAILVQDGKEVAVANSSIMLK
jgi:acyl-CoA thioesterase